MELRFYITVVCKPTERDILILIQLKLLLGKPGKIKETIAESELFSSIII